MAKKKSEATQGAPQVPPNKGIALLKSQVDKAYELLSSRPLDKDAYSSWQFLTRNYLEKAFGANARNINRVMRAGPGFYALNPSDDEVEAHQVEQLQSQVQQLEAAMELLRTEAQLKQGEPAVASSPQLGHRVFLVHGHDEGVLNEVARFLEKLKYEPVVLKEQPGKGRTIMEKFEDCASDAGFVVVLLTADDRGGPADKPYEAQQPRARQNVVLELGYFVGRLGRARVCALLVPNVEVPSDYGGVQYVSLDGTGAWRFELAKEMKAAGLDMNMNPAL